MNVSIMLMKDDINGFFYTSLLDKDIERMKGTNCDWNKEDFTRFEELNKAFG